MPVSFFVDRQGMQTRPASHADGSAVSRWRPQTASEVARVVENRPLNGEYHHLVLACSGLAASARPGQFFQLQCPDSPGTSPYLRRPMSVYAASAETGCVEFLFKVAGAGTLGLSRLRAGDSLPIFGPLGHGFSLDPAWRSIVLVGRGAGLATLAPLAATAHAMGIAVTAILSARHPDLVVSREVMLANGADVVCVTDADASSEPANVERLLRALIERDACDALFTCGSARLLRLLQSLVREHGLPGQVALEQQMACGIGACHCCVRDFRDGNATVSRRVCWDGPVFELAEPIA